MTREDLFVAIGRVDEMRLARSNRHRIPSKNAYGEEPVMNTYDKPLNGSGRRSVKKLWVIAAVIGTMLLLMGCAAAVRYVVAILTFGASSSADTGNNAAVESSGTTLARDIEIKAEDIQLTVSDVTPTSMRIYCVIDGAEKRMDYIDLLISEPYMIEKKTENGWEALLVQTDFWKKDHGAVTFWKEFDWPVNWSATYGMLESGTYRFTTVLVEGVDPVSVEFTVPASKDTTLADAANKLLREDAYYVRCSNSYEFGSLDSVQEKARTHLENRIKEADASYSEYWKCGNDLMHFSYEGGKIKAGMMYKNGILYVLDYEGDNRNNPIIGWTPNFGAEHTILTNWVNLLSGDDFAGEAEYDQDGLLVKAIMTQADESIQETYHIDATVTRVWEVISTDQAMAAARFAEQDIDVVRPFSWSEDQTNMTALDVEFVNTTAKKIAKASEAISHAMRECHAKYDKIIAYRDESAGMWKIEFQIGFGYHGYWFVYLDDDGVTQMISGAGSKVEAWKDKYPGP